MPNIAFLIFNRIHTPTTVTAVFRFGLLSGLFLCSELLFQTLTGTIGSGFFRAAFFILLGSALVTIITLCLPKLAALLILEAAVLTVSLLSVGQLLYLRIFNEFVSIDMMRGGGEAIYRFSGILTDTMLENIPGILLLLLPAFIPPALYLLRRFPAASRMQVKHAIIPIVVLCALRYSLLIPAAIDSYSPLAVRYGQGDVGRIATVSNVGLFTAMEIDVLSQVFSAGTSSVLDSIPDMPALSLSPPAIPVQPPPKTPELPDASGTIANATDPSDTGDPEPPDLPPEPPPWVGKFNGFDIDFEALIERDKNNRGLRQLHEYFSTLTPSAQNERTGLFEGYNLITICAEAFTGWVIDPELTPTLYMMQNEGVYFENFYSLYGAGTIGGEFALCSGFMPRGRGGWCTGAAGNYLPFTFASRFLDLGIQPLAYHNGSYTFYDRNVLFPRLGYDFKAYGGGLSMAEYGWSTSDVILFKLTVDEYINMERFYVHYMTYSGHSGYSFGNPQAAVNRDAVSHLPYSSEVRAYIACQLEFEYAMAYLLGRLEEAGIAERTVIVITSDHYPYGLEHDKTEELAGKRLDFISQLFESAGIIYVKGMQPVTVAAPAYVPDMLPTVLNLLGLRFDSRFLPGRDVFSDDAPFVILGSGVVTEAGVYNKHNRRLTLFDGIEEVPEGYASAIAAIEAARTSAVEQIVNLNYFESIRSYLE